jgi:anaerobic magnesium-protoporphyrin IX monomethyl ester cyclase
MNMSKNQQTEMKPGPFSRTPESTVGLSPGPTRQEFEHVVTLMRQHRYTDAEVFARKITQRFPALGLAWKIFGTSLLLQGKTNESLEPMQRAAELIPRDPDVHLNLGVIFYDLGRFGDAETNFRTALAIKPDYANGHNNLGNALRSLRRLGEAEASFRRALAIKPDFAEAQSNLGHTLRDQGRLDEAEACYRRALEIKPDFAEAQSNLGHILRDQGRLDEALVRYRLALKAKGDWKEALRRLTNPLILHTGMVLDPLYPGKNLDKARMQPFTFGDQEKHLQTLPASSASGPGVVKKQRIILIYPPPYQIPSHDETMMGMPFGPPKDPSDRDMDGDFRTITYGLLTIAAQARRAGYSVSIYNLATCPWTDLVKLVAETEADVYGISAFTANRRGMGAVASLIRQYHPHAHITVGGPFVTALPLETVRYYRDIDTAVIGEGEETFMELLAYLDAGRPVAGIPGIAWRNGQEITIEPRRPRINDLDGLASPFDYFSSNIVMTSRGCPGNCSFCGSFTTWGRKLRFHSAESTLDTFKKALATLPVPYLAIKDDTFTAHRQRAIAICDAIIESKLNFLWSCDTRVDYLDDELLRKMRLTGCQMISLGVESGSPDILKRMNKKTTPEMVLEATRMAKKYGMFVRYYMILINRGETPETIRQSIDLIKAGRPNDYAFSALTFFPGTEDWAILCAKQDLAPDIFFNNDFQSLDVSKNRSKDYNHVHLYTQCGIGAINGFKYTVEEREAVIARLPHVPVTYVELANAYYQAGRYDEATAALHRAQELGFPISNIIDNLQACIYAARGDIGSALHLLEKACQIFPAPVIKKNLATLRALADSPAQARDKQILLNDSILALDFSWQKSDTPCLSTL